MTMPIKIQCGCGQRYSFEAETVNGRMAAAIACPACGADGTDAANAVLANAASPAPADTAPLRIAIPLHVEAAAPARSARPQPSRLPGQVDHAQAEHEARAKISWGDPPQEVIKYLLLQGFTAPEASMVVGRLVKERATTIRNKGILKIIIGVALVCVPLPGAFILMNGGRIRPRPFGFAIAVGICGLVVLISGLFMALAPKSHGGDLAEDNLDPDNFDD